MKLHPRLQQALPWVIYPSVYLVLFVLFAYSSFPYDRLKERLVVSYNAAQQDNPQPGRVEIGDITWSWRFPGIVVKDVDLYGPMPKPASDGDKVLPQRHAKIQELYVGFSALSYLFGTTAITFDLEGFDGEVSGEFTSSKTEQKIVVELSKVDPGQLPGVTETLQLPISGNTSGKIELRLPEGKYSLADGSADLTVANLKIGDGQTKIRDLIALPAVNAGTLTLKATSTQGRVKVEKFDVKGPDLEAEAEGRVRLREKLATSLVEQMSLSFKFSDKYRDRDDSTRALLGKAGDPMGGIIDFDPKVKQAKQADGSYVWKVMGAFSNLAFSPSRPATPSASAKKPPVHTDTKGE